MLLSYDQLKVKTPLLLILCLIFFSCQKYSSVDHEEQRVAVHPRPLRAHDIKIQEWKVGIERKQTVSRGFTVTIDVPQLRNNDLRRIINEYGVDSWLIQMKKGSHVLQSGVVMIGPNRRQSRAIQFNVQYAASAISTRFANSPCPAFNHKKILENISFFSTHSSLTQLNLGLVNETRQSGPFHTFEMRPLSINGGHSLVGNYFFDIAFFDTRTRTIKSNFVDFPQAVQIRSEREGTIIGCEGYIIPTDPAGNRLDGFHFGR